MTWATIDDAILDHPKVLAAGPIGFGLLVASIIYSNRNLTDGWVPYGQAQRLLSTTWTSEDEAGSRVWELASTSGALGLDGTEAVQQAIQTLLRLELWTEESGGYQIHDYEDWNETRETVLAKRATRAEAGSAGGKASAQARAKANGRASGQANAQANGQASAQANLNPLPLPLPLLQDLFSQFWQTYPRREGKQAALKAFEKALRRAPFAEILFGAQRYRDDPNREPRFTKMAQGWLNDGRWEDDPLPPRSGKTSKTQRLLALADRMEGDAT